MARIVQFTPPVRMREYFGAGGGKQTSFADITLTLRGRDAIALAAAHFGLEGRADDVVLLPGYLCDTITGALASKCGFLFYDLRPDFSIDPSVIEKHASKRRIRVLYVIHYFGFLQRGLAELAALCERYNMKLLEDHAHSALSRFSWEYADGMIFSFRKVLPVPDGGGLWLRDIPDGVGLTRSVWASDVLSMTIEAKRRLCYLSGGVRRVFDNLIQHDIDNLNAGRRAIRARPISHMSRRIVQGSPVDHLFKVRREQFRLWATLLKGWPFQPVFPSLPDDVCPQGFPIWIGNPDEIVSRLERFGIFLKIHWPTILEEVARTCPMTLKMSKSIVTLPIYPGLSSREMRRIAALLSLHGQPVSCHANGEF